MARWITYKGKHLLVDDDGQIVKQKKYDKKDIEPIKKWYSKNPIGYKVGNVYLLKNYYGLRQTEQYNWIITKKEYGYSWINEIDKAIKNDEAFFVDNFKIGKEKLLEVANKNFKGKKVK